MNRKGIYVVGGFFLLFIIVFGGSIISNNNTEDAYYILASNNFFSRCGILLSDCLYYLVDIVLGGICSVFNIFLN